jgi:predicted ATP-dependent endonuclease of OLD family
MVNSKGSILLVDEFESGLHWSVQKSLWDIVFLLSKELDIQVIATTHSRDCIEAFQKSAISSNQADNALLIKLIEKNNKLKSKVFSLEDVQLAMEEDIEIR